MRRILFFVVLLGTLCACGADDGRRTEDFNFDWRFALGDDAAYAAVDFDDSAWRQLHLPHDWAVEGDFSKDNPSTPGGGALPGGVGWYRKEFATPKGVAAGRRLYVEFDGVFMNSTVYINGTPLGTRPYGYSSFSYDLTPHLAPSGHRNVIAVRCDNADQPNSRWYAGCGIYRNVRIVEFAPLHAAYNGIYVSTPEVSADEALVRVETTVANDGTVAF
ncbi:MAG: beta galactosidase jelly roll domain-containing protein, partial [Alistipes sp.]|nr:beta galactosidase jelly roll domain-containing protein [Alistipes sp.]